MISCYLLSTLFFVGKTVIKLEAWIEKEESSLQGVFTWRHSSHLGVVSKQWLSDSHANVWEIFSYVSDLNLF